MKHLRKLSTLLLAIVMIFTMGMSVFAESGSGTNLGPDTSINPDKTGPVSNGGVRENGTDSGETDSAGKHTHGTFTAVGETITLDKEIIIFNTRSSKTIVYLPNIKYEYEVEAADVDDGKSITDEYGNKGTINDGVAAAIDNGTTKPFVQFSNGNVGDAGISGTGMTAVTTPYVTTTKAGVAAEGHFNLKFKASEFTKPGVYRYKITEKVTDGAKAAAGITDNGTYNDVRYLDVYVQNNAAGTAREIYGYVLFEDATDAQNKTFTANPGTAITAKTNGFVSDKNDDDTKSYSKTEVGVDIYETSNVKIQKTITGVMADMNNEFPFEATITNSTIQASPIISYVRVESGNNETTDAADNPTVSMATTGTGKIGNAASGGSIVLGNGDFIYVYGVPGKESATSTGTTEVMVKEFNNTAEEYTVSATYDTAAVKVSDDDESNQPSVQMKAGKVSELYEAQKINITQETDPQDVVVVTNKLNSISPTNVVLRFAPYLFILGGAVLMLMISRRRKAEQE